METNKLYDTIKLRRNELGLSQEQLARKAGVDRSTIAKVESGDRGINSNILLKIIAELDLELEFSTQAPRDAQEEYSVETVAEALITEANGQLGEDYDVSNMKINKLLYYAQMFAIGKLGHPLFSERIEAWTHGPVCRQIYAKYSEHGRDIINDYVSTTLKDVEAQKIIKEVIARFGGMSARQLRNKTHGEQPWRAAMKRGGQNEAIAPSALKTQYDSEYAYINF